MRGVLMHGQRGQTLPVVLGGIVATIAFAFFALNYANQLRWQIRAQTAADSAAQAMLSLQATQFNQMTATLYSTAVEEYRIQHLISGMVHAAYGQGGCTLATNAAPTGCYYVQQTLQTQYMSAVQRYTADVLLLHQVTAKLNFTNIKTDATRLLADEISSCSSAFSGDCAFHYSSVMQPRSDMEAVYMTQNAVREPNPGTASDFPLASTDTAGASGKPLNVSNSAADLFAPIEVEVYSCAQVPPLVPLNFFGLAYPTFTVLARGAATTTMVVEDWMEPGSLVNPYTNTYYQPPEQYVQQQLTDGANYDWYDLDFRGNSDTVNANGITFKVQEDDFSVFLGWWNSIPIHPFITTPVTSANVPGCAA